MKTLLDRARTERIVWDCSPEADILWSSASRIEQVSDWRFPVIAIQIDEIAERGLVSDPSKWEAEVISKITVPQSGYWFEWGDRGCWIDTRGYTQSDGIHASRPAFVPVSRLPDGGCYVHPVALTPGIWSITYGDEEPCERPRRADDISVWDTRHEKVEPSGRHTVWHEPGTEAADTVAIEAAWYAVAALLLQSSAGIGICERDPQPDRWRKRYQKRRGEPPAERIRLSLEQPKMTETDRHVSFHYTRTHTKFYSGHPGHRFFGSTEPRTVTTPGFWSGNINKGITIDRLDHS